VRVAFLILKTAAEATNPGNWKRGMNMAGIGVSRRKALEAGACALAGAAGFLVTGSVPAGAESSTATEEVVRKWYKAWVEKDEGQFEALMADNFTFTSAAGDDHISRSTFKTQCWDTQAKLIERSDLERVMVSGNEAFVKYLCRTTNGKSFRNVEYLRVRDGKVENLECYFGGAGYPSAASKGM
jgi:ketosteroid isomerase-like protein